MDCGNQLDISIVTYKASPEVLDRLASTLVENLNALPAEYGKVTVRVLDNSEDPLQHEVLETALKSIPLSGHCLIIELSAVNLGFGTGHNANLANSKSDFVLLLNQDIEIEPNALTDLLARACADDSNVAAWEMRQIPYEHPKDYDPVSMDTEWVSGAATLFRREALLRVKGFDSRIFMYGEDVDLSWRLRAAGWRLHYVPCCGVVHRTYEVPGEIKRLQVLGGTLTNLCLRARYGGGRRVLQGLAMICAELFVPQAFPGRRWGLFLNIFRFLWRFPYFWRTRVFPTTTFQPRFAGWSYELRREGAFFEFPSRRDWPGADAPKVSILVRTIGRHAWLKQALSSLANQTYPRVEVVLVEDGPATCAEVVEEFSRRIPILYEALGTRQGRSIAGNRALALATGEWLGFLDDDDLLFADHVEVCLYSALKYQVAAVYAIGWETHTRTLDNSKALYREEVHFIRHAQSFDRVTLWHHNFLPIQTVLFHRRLYEKHQGFAEDMEQLEDWNLWTRYSLEDDFLYVPKVTSKYRVPAENHVSQERQRALDLAYQDAVQRQADMRFITTPREVAGLVDKHVSVRSLVRLEIPHPRNWSWRPLPVAWLLARRNMLRALAGRMGLLR
jgi:GT2 family glycosyltransferase